MYYTYEALHEWRASYNQAPIENQDNYICGIPKCIINIFNFLEISARENNNQLIALLRTVWKRKENHFREKRLRVIFESSNEIQLFVYILFLYITTNFLQPFIKEEDMKLCSITILRIVCKIVEAI